MTDGENTLHNKPISLLPPIRIREHQRKHEARGIKTFMDAFVVTDPDARSDPAQLAMSVGMEEHIHPEGLLLSIVWSWWTNPFVSHYAEFERRSDQ